MRYPVMLARSNAPLTIAATLLVATAALAQGLPASPLFDYHTEAGFIPQTPTVTIGAPGGFINPGVMTIGEQSELAIWWNDRVQTSGMDSWGFGTSNPLALTMDSQLFDDNGDKFRVDNWQLSLSGAARDVGLGIAYRWATNEADRIGRENAFVAGLVARPGRLTTFGAAGQWSTKTGARQGVFDLGLRPWRGQDYLVLFADYTLDQKEKIDEGRWGVGATIRPVRGLQLGVKFREDETQERNYLLDFQVGVTLRSTSFDVIPTTGEDDLSYSTGMLRFNPPFPSMRLLENLSIGQPPQYVPIDLQNKWLTYQRYQMFDNRRVAWLDLAAWLDAIAADPHIAGVALNLLDFRARPSLIWELRRKLQELQAAGKEVIIHTGRLEMLDYYLVSVADHLTTDPMAGITLPGVALNRTYLKNMLAKLGLGFQEFRYFDYKSAVEVLSRDSMSEGDRVQRQRIADVLFATMQDGSTEGRDLAPGTYRQLVDEVVMILPPEALAQGLVDGVGQWQDVARWLHRERGGAQFGPVHKPYKPNEFPDGQWGEAPQIAVVYAVGVCAMDSGIKGRATSRFLQSLIYNPRVKAVVLRADSPGGDPLPSELVAEAVRDLRAAGKPVIVSQGDVAASGGYWISMDGAQILTTPLTITGSIGVISGWLYDDGFSEKVGMTSDGVQVGAHADLFRGLSLPLLGGNLATRPMDEDELAMVRQRILEMYDAFIARVAQGRGLPEERVKDLAQGRVWMGGDAIENGLADRYGSLPEAVELARTAARVPDYHEIEVLEFPPRPLFEWPSFGTELPQLMAFIQPLVNLWARIFAQMPPDDLASSAVDADYGISYLQALAQRPAEPVLITAPEYLPQQWYSGN